MTIYYTHKYSGEKAESHSLLEVAIADYLGDRDAAHGLVSNIRTNKPGTAANGKPYIEGFSEFSISHSGSSWAVLISDRPCGLDIQYERSCDCLSISKRFFAGEDAAVVAAASDITNGSASVRTEFFKIWTRREAFIKAIGSSVVYDSFPPVGSTELVVHEDTRYFVNNISFHDAAELYAAICLEAETDIDEKLHFKEIYVREENRS